MILDFLEEVREAVLPGLNKPIDPTKLREAQISLCQHAPAVTKGVDSLPPILIKWFVVKEALSFKSPDELAISSPFPSYRQMIAHLDVINRQIEEGAPVPEIFSDEHDIITAVQLRSETLWLDMAVSGSFVSFTCLGLTTRKLEPGRILLFAA